MEDAAKIEELESEIDTLRDEIESLKKEVDSAVQDVQEAESNADAAEKEKAETEDDLEDAKDEIAELQGDLAEKQLDAQEEINDCITRIIALSRSPQKTPQMVDAICECLELIGACQGATKANVREAVRTNLAHWRHGMNEFGAMMKRRAA